MYSILETLPFRSVLGTFGGAGNPANAGLDISPDQRAKLRNQTRAGYFDATLHLTDAFSISGGIRYSRDDKDFTGGSRTVLSGTVFLPAGSELHPSFSSWTPRLGAEYKISDDILLYGSFAKGFKSGGINPSIQRPTDFVVFDPEKQTTYELGLKSEWLDRRLRLNLAAFTSSYSGIQLRATLAPGQLTCPTTVLNNCQIIVNAAEARIKGFESEVSLRPLEGLTLSGGAGYVDAKFTKIAAPLLAANVVTFARKLPKTPKWSANVAAQYDTSLGEVGTLSLRADYSYRSKIYQDIENSETIAQRGFGLLSARIAYTTANDRWEFALAGLNLTNKLYITTGFDGLRTGAGYAEAHYGAPRTWTASVKVRFGE